MGMEQRRGVGAELQAVSAVWLDDDCSDRTLYLAPCCDVNHSVCVRVYVRNVCVRVCENAKRCVSGLCVNDEMCVCVCVLVHIMLCV